VKKIIGLSCGRKNGNSEFFLKAAAMGAEEFGVTTEIIRAMALKVLPCNMCRGCAETHKCVLKDDVDWILEKTMVEDAALIVAAPCYHIRANGYFMCINERMNHVFAGDMNVLKKTRVGAIISVGGSGYEGWTSLTLPTINIFLQETRVLVDQIQINYTAARGYAVAPERKESLERAKELGRNVARAMSMPIEEVKYVGEDTPVSCPVCHCNILYVPDKLPHVACPVCWVRGVISSSGDSMNVDWNREDSAHPRFSHDTIEHHVHWIGDRAKIEMAALAQPETQEMVKRFSAYGTIIQPSHDKEKVG
jgi:multimeric flavodoxin WrbA